MSDITDLIPKRYLEADFNLIPEDIKGKLSGLKEKGLYLWGGCGSGKTYICYAIFKEGRNRGMNIMVRNFPSMLNQIKGKDNLNDEIRDIANYNGILIIDDIGAEKMSEWVAETLYIIINTRYENCSPTIFISNLSLQKLEEVVGDRIPSRISEMCHIMKIDNKDRRLTP
jgi:DNA replication protein DnaC